MTDFSQSWSPLADALLAAVARAALHGGIGILAVVAVCALLPQISVSLRCWLWRFAFARLVIALFWSAPVALPVTATPSPPVAANELPAVSVSNAAPFFETSPAAPKPETDPRVGLLFLWLAGAVWCGRSGLRHLRAAEALRRAATQVTDPATLRQWQELGDALGLRQLPELRETTGIESPVCLHTLRSTVVLPANLSEGWDRDQIRLMLAHELAHIRRHDLAWSWLPASAHLLFYFHPLVWLANREWRLAHDMAADDLALQVTHAAPSEYARLLVRVAGARSQSSAGLAMMDPRDTAQTLRRRLTAMKRLLNNSGKSTPAAWLLSLLLAGAILVPVRVIAQATASRSSDAPQVERPAAGRGDVTIAPESDDRGRKAREAERTDPAAGARVAAPQPRKPARPDVSDDLYLRRAYLDAKGVLPTREEARKFERDTAPGKRKAVEDKFKNTDDHRLRQLEGRIKALELELRLLREQNLSRDGNKRKLDRDRAPMEERLEIEKSLKRKWSEDRLPRDPNLEEPLLRDKKKRKHPREIEKSLDGEVDGELQREIELKSIKKRLKEVEIEDVRRELGSKLGGEGLDGRRGLGSKLGGEGLDGRRGLGSKLGGEGLDIRKTHEAAGEGGSLLLGVQMFRRTPDGNRRLSATETSLRLGEWIAVGLPSGKLKDPLDQADAEQTMFVRVSQGKSKGVLTVEVRMSRSDSPKVIAARIGKPFVLHHKGESNDASAELIELRIIGGIGTPF